MQLNMKANKRFRKYGMLLLGAVVLVLGIWIGNAIHILNVDAATKPKAPTLTIVSRTTSSVNLKYTKVSGATGYQIYRSNSKNGTYEKIKTTKELTYKDTDTISSKVYYYKVRAYKKERNKTTYGNYSAIKQVKACLGKVSNLKATSATKAIKLTWGSVSRATNYRIYRATSKNGTYSFLNSTTSTSYTDKSITEGKNYYYKVKAYATISSTKYYGSNSAIVSGKSKVVADNAGTDSKSYEQQVVDLINKERKAEGLSPVTLDTRLQEAAYKRAMETADVFSHTRPDGTSCFTVLDDFNISYMACGENIAYGQRTPEAVMTAWMNSSGHRANILSKNFGKVGIGYYVVNNTPYWVQLFTN